MSPGFEPPKEKTHENNDELQNCEIEKQVKQ